MQKAGSPLGKRWHVVVFITALLILTADQLTKLWIRSYSEGHVINDLGILRLTHIHNTGAAFGLFPGQSFALTIVSAVGIALILFWALFMHNRYPLLANMPNRIALGLVLGGTVGNLIDRIHFGYVIDFIDFRVWPAFNVADSAVIIGVIIIAYSLIRTATAQKH